MSKTLSSVKRSGLTIGITMAALPDFTALFANGIGQNGIFLALLMQRLPLVKRVVLFVPGSEIDGAWMQATFGIEVRPHTEGIVEVDVLFELGWRVDKETVKSLRARGGKFVSYVGGNQMVMNLEAVACKLPRGEQQSEAGFDATWVTPQHWRTNVSYLLMTREAAVYEVPHIWDPVCLHMAQQARPDIAHYKPQRGAKNGGKRIGVFDPNVNVVKTFHIPALICEVAFREASAKVGSVMLFCTDHLKDYLHFKEFVNSLDVFKAGKLFAESRYPILQTLGTHVDVVVTHQWENALNYLYYDVLYLGYPLIHNSEYLKDAGYYYPDFDPKSGGKALLEALNMHDEVLAGYRLRSQAAWWRAAIDNPLVQEQHERLLLRLFDSKQPVTMRVATRESYVV